ncbi:MAG: glycosyltransferase family 9 protein [Chitinispirillales bacterium]|jgi:ADP-heptose:LPS heptosyltransferase|nr:glycosyltransferase family 9 protein [Chitinispirillales bacterium]
MAEICAEKILVIQTRPYGDVLLAASYLGALRQKFPNAIIDFFVSKPFDEVLANNPFINNVLASPSKKNKLGYVFGRVRLLIRIFFANYRLVIDQQADGGSRAIVIVSRAKYRLGWAYVRSAPLYNLKAAPRKNRYYPAVRNFDLLSPLDIEYRKPDFFFHINEESNLRVDKWVSENSIDTKEIIIFSPGAKASWKAWNPDSYAALADMIVEKYDLKIAVIWAPSEFEAALRMKNSMKAPAFFLEKTTYNEAAAFVKRARLLICNDGGLNHLSVVLGTPSLAFFCRTDPQHWSPQDYFEHHYHMRNAEFVKNNSEDPNNTFGITAPEAFKKVEFIFEKLGIETKAAN